MRKQIRKILTESDIGYTKHIEYWVETIDEYGDIVDQESYEGKDKARAMKHFDSIKLDDEVVGAVVERVTRYGKGLKGVDATYNLDEQEYEVIAKKGDHPVMEDW